MFPQTDDRVAEPRPSLPYDPGVFRRITDALFPIGRFSIDERNGLLALDREALINIGTTLAAMAVYVPAMMTLGFVVSSAILIAFLSTVYGNRNYLLTAAVAIIVPVTIFFIFTKLLATSLPPFPIDSVLTRYFVL